MSVTFSLRGGGHIFDFEGNETGEPYVNFSNANCRRVLMQLCLPGAHSEALYGEIRGKALREACERYLADPVSSIEAARDPTMTQTPGGATFIEGGSEAGAFSYRIKKLHELACRAGDLGVVIFG